MGFLLSKEGDRRSSSRQTRRIYTAVDGSRHRDDAIQVCFKRKWKFKLISRGFKVTTIEDVLFA